MITDKNLVLIAYILFIIMILISCNLYLTNQYDENGNSLNLNTVIKKIFNRFDDINIINIKVRTKCSVDDSNNEESEQSSEPTESESSEQVEPVKQVELSPSNYETEIDSSLTDREIALNNRELELNKKELELNKKEIEVEKQSQHVHETDSLPHVEDVWWKI